MVSFISGFAAVVLLVASVCSSAGATTNGARSLENVASPHSRVKRTKIRSRRRRTEDAAEDAVTIQGICAPGSDMPFVATEGNSCGVPEFVDTEIFGDNMDTSGKMVVKPTAEGLDIKIKLKNVPKPDLVMTAWLIWVPGGVTDPPIFEVANHASPCAPFTAAYTTGFGRDANEFKYKKRDATKATYKTSLNFNPTYMREGPLTREVFCFQKDVPGIQDTVLAQSTTPDGVYIPTSSDYLRRYDPDTGYEMLMPNGDPMVMRSPVSSLGVEVIIHTDKTTHGVSQGVGGVDHYFMIFFPFTDAIGSPTMTMMT